MSKKKGMNSYVKYILMMFVFAAVGGIVGFCVAYFDDLKDLKDLNISAGSLLGMVQDNILPLLVIFTALAVICNEMVLYRMRKLEKELAGADDEECDIFDYELERIGNIGVIACNVFMIGSLLILSTGYSMKYIENAVRSEGINLIAAIGVFLINNLYIGIWQMRYVKLIQKIYPEKKGDPASRKFQEQWLESCDEAEKGAIYQACYKTYLRISKCFPVFALIAMLCHLMWNTGIMAVVMVCALWLLTSVTYSRSCLTKRKEKLGR